MVGVRVELLTGDNLDLRGLKQLLLNFYFTITENTNKKYLLLVSTGSFKKSKHLEKGNSLSFF